MGLKGFFDRNDDLSDLESERASLRRQRAEAAQELAELKRALSERVAAVMQRERELAEATARIEKREQKLEGGRSSRLEAVRLKLAEAKEARAMLDGETSTHAEGLATRVPFELPQRILWEHLDDFVLVSEDEIRKATRLMIEHTRNLVEPAGAAPLAAALTLRDRLRGKRIALVASGGNISPAQLAALYA